MSYAAYEAAKVFWLKTHPLATAAQYEAACKRLARQMGV